MYDSKMLTGWMVIIAFCIIAFVITTIIKPEPISKTCPHTQSITLERGKTYRIFDKVVTLDELPITIKNALEDMTVTDVTITRVGTVASIQPTSSPPRQKGE